MPHTLNSTNFRKCRKFMDSVEKAHFKHLHLFVKCNINIIFRTRALTGWYEYIRTRALTEWYEYIKTRALTEWYEYSPYPSFVTENKK